ncbi:fatty acid desaturase, partial [Acinetobacter baumannii]
MLMRGLAGYVPLGLLSWGLWYAILAFHTANGLASLFAADIGWNDATLARIQLVDLLVVTWVAPNVLRTFCLHFVTSNMHYFGDVEDGNV